MREMNRQPPQAIEIERSVIGACILSPEIAQQSAFILEPDDFYLKKHQVTFQTIQELANQGEVIDLNILYERMKANGHQDTVKASYLAELLDKDPVPPNIETSCRILKQKAAERRLLESCKTIAQGCYEGKSPQELIEQAQKDIDAVREYIEAAVEQGPRSAFRLDQISTLETRAPEWLIKGLLEKFSLVQIFGDPGCGKTFIGNDAAGCVASEVDFHGRPVKKGPVIYIAGEGQNGIARRFKAWAIRHGVDLDQAPLYISTTPASFCDEASAAEVKKAIEATGETPALVIVDTLARNFGPGDENSTQDMSAFISALDQIRTRYRCAILLIHHTGHADKTRSRGAMALKGALDAEYRMWKDEQGTVRLENTKIKDFEPPEPMAFKIRTVELGITDEDGEEVTSAILDSIDYEPPENKGKSGRGKQQTAALQILDDLYEKQRANLEAGGLNPDNVRVLETDWRNKCYEAGMAKTTLHSCRKSLTEQGIIKIEHGYIERIG